MMAGRMGEALMERPVMVVPLSDGHRAGAFPRPARRRTAGRVGGGGGGAGRRGRSEGKMGRTQLQPHRRQGAMGINGSSPSRVSRRVKTKHK